MFHTDSYSYFKAFKMFAKQRWFTHRLTHIFSIEFNKPESYFKQAISSGSIKINNRRVDVNYNIKPKDYISHIVHVHEPIYRGEIQVIHTESDFMVVNKPPGIASHPTTNYYFYSITKILEKRYGKMACINRLDVPTSGILLLSSSNRYHEVMRNRKIEKIYIAKVKDNFIDQEVSSSIKQVRGSFSKVSEKGKICHTKFKNLKFKDGFSIVECRPLTGRSHQIRVHLKSIGFPIVGDILYNDEYKSRYCPVEYVCNGNVNIEGKEDVILEEPEEECKKFAVINCEGVNNRVYVNREENICLHAYKYIIDGVVYTAPLPDWAKLEN